MKILKAIRKHPIGYLVVVLILVLTIYYLTGKIPEDNIYFKPDFIVSFRASLLEDIIFFSSVGVIMYIASFRSSEDDQIDTRIASIINAELASVSSKDYFKEKIGEILSYYDYLDVTLTISNYDELEHVVKIEAYFEGDIINMSRDLQLKTLIKAYARAGKIINNQAGEVKILQIIDKVSAEKLIDISRSSKPISPDKEFALKEIIEISPNGKVNYQYGFWIWSELQSNNTVEFINGFKFSADRFVNRLNINIKNITNIAIDTIIWREQEGGRGEKELKVIYSSDELTKTNTNIECITTSLRHGEIVSLGLSFIEE
jgi:hypothetical protein